jgi:hypothetical protein
MGSHFVQRAHNNPQYLTKNWALAIQVVANCFTGWNVMAYRLSNWMFEKYWIQFRIVKNENKWYMYILHFQIQNDWIVYRADRFSHSQIEPFHHRAAETRKYHDIEWTVCTWSETVQWNYFGKYHEIEDKVLVLYVNHMEEVLETLEEEIIWKTRTQMKPVILKRFSENGGWVEETVPCWFCVHYIGEKCKCSNLAEHDHIMARTYALNLMDTDVLWLWWGSWKRDDDK